MQIELFDQGIIECKDDDLTGLGFRILLECDLHQIEKSSAFVRFHEVLGFTRTRNQINTCAD